ncbi:bacterioferritin-associated ferredoxin [Cryptosporangium sp. NPDC048952]|uniref:(2Fe-2S)-binding protein n=1 Tax=Cryptosporangium sp. NPDC048952 TaxID=3363961 RepID=UPI0037138991
MYVCICARVRESEVRMAISAGARDEFDVGEACGAGTGCGSCVERICGLIQDGETPLARAS